MRFLSRFVCAALLAVTGACSDPNEPKEADCYAAMARVRAERGEPSSEGYSIGADGHVSFVWKYGATTYVFQWGGTLSGCTVTIS